jgi:hypothetical protein
MCSVLDEYWDIESPIAHRYLHFERLFGCAGRAQSDP